jgi:hypothetical protein
VGGLVNNSNKKGIESLMKKKIEELNESGDFVDSNDF